MDYEDPGWRPILRSLAMTAIPLFGWLAWRRRIRSVDPLTAFRSVYLGIASAVWIWAFLLLFMVPRRQWFDLGRTNSFFWVVVGVGITSLAYVQSIRARSLNTSSPGALSVSCRAQTFIGIGVSEAAALAGFVGSFVMGTWWIYLVGATFATMGLVLIGPSRREIARRQEQITSRGSSLSLGKALMGPTSTG